MNAFKLLLARYTSTSLVLRIFIGLVLGILLAWMAPATALKVNCSSSL